MQTMGIARINAAKVSAEEIAKALRSCADLIIKIDGDRDHMNHSDLTCEQVMEMAKIMHAAADKLDPAHA